MVQIMGRAVQDGQVVGTLIQANFCFIVQSANDDNYEKTKS